jgi:hypothetical protein
MNSKEKLNILDAIISCDYLINNRDYIISLFYDYFMSKNVSMYITMKLNSQTLCYEKILVVRLIIKVQLQPKFYDVPILIYLPKMFPGEPPEMFIESNGEIGVNIRNICIDKNTMKIKVTGLTKWNSSSNISNVVNEIIDEFTKIFPVYKLDIKDKGKFNYGENCKLNYENLQHVTFDASSKVEKNTLSNLIDLNDLNFKINNQPVIVKPFVKINFTDDQIKQIYINELKSILIPKIKFERKKLQSHEEKLLNYGKLFTKRIDQTKSLADRKDDVINKIQSLSSNIRDEMIVYKNYIELNSQLNLNFQNIEKLVYVSDTPLIKTIAAEAVLEDYLFYVKKAYEKKVFNFQDTIKIIRNHSREMYNLKFYRETKLTILNNFK